MPRYRRIFHNLNESSRHYPAYSASTSSNTDYNPAADCNQNNYSSAMNSDSDAGHHHNQQNDFLNSTPPSSSDPIGLPTLLLPDTSDQLCKMDHLIRSVREVIACCACFSCEESMKECSNGHLLCQQCFLTLRQDDHPQCPTCRVGLYSDTRRALTAQKVLAELPESCPDCCQSMLHKDLAGHRLNLCTKRVVACGLSALGCSWIGSADDYPLHVDSCSLRRQLSSQSIGSTIDQLLGRFHKREQAMRETFHCFANALRHLESHELQTMTVLLSCANTTSRSGHYRSDQFHLNQSRWTLEVFLNFPAHPDDNDVVTGDGEEGIEQDDGEHGDVQIGRNSEVVTLTPSIDSPDDDQSVDDRSESETTTAGGHVYSSRRRRWHNNSSSRHHPYQRHHRSNQFASNNQSSAVDNNHQSAPRSTSEQNNQSASSRRPNHHASNNNTSEVDNGINGELTYRLTKENGTSMGRRSYAFLFLQLRVPDSGVQIYARPQIQSHRFASRGDGSPLLNIHPTRWRYLTKLSELTKHRLIQVDLMIARRVNDDQGLE